MVPGPTARVPSSRFRPPCGSTGGRGLPLEPPLSAGGRIGEWLTGTYAALGAIAAYREAVRLGTGRARRRGHARLHGCNNGYLPLGVRIIPGMAAAERYWADGRGALVEPTSDGFAVFTTNSAQQFQDFLVMIGRPDLLDDPDLPSAVKRFARRDEFLSVAHDYTVKHTTAEVLEDASLFRIPAGPVLNGSTILDFEQFVERGVFVPSPSGRFVQPRVPFAISGISPRPFGHAPGNGEHTESFVWAEPTRPKAEPEDGRSWQLPLAGLRVVDCTAWWAGPAATSVLANLGADVIKVESVTRPDQMRFASTRPPTEERWWEWGPVFHTANVGKRAVTLDLTRPEGKRAFERLVDTADVLVENYTPRVIEQFGLGWEQLHALNPELIMVRMPAFGLSGPWRDRTGFAQTMECLTGMAWMTGAADGPPVLLRGACDPLAGMHAVIGTLLAVLERDRSGGGRHIETVMVEAALNAAAEQVVEYGASGSILRRDGNRGPVSAPQGIYQCAGEDQWVAIAVATDDQWKRLSAASWANRPGATTLTSPQRRGGGARI